MENYVLINTQTNIVDNLVVWDGSTQTWTPPTSHIAVPQATTPRVVWIFDEQTSTWSTQEIRGTGMIGDVWDGAKLNQPQP